MPIVDHKMSGKQEVVKGFDLNAFVGASEPEEVDAIEPSKLASKPAPVAKVAKPLVEVTNAAKMPKENLTERVQIRLSKSEMSKLSKQCGLVPSSAFLRDFMKKNGLI